MVKLFPYVFLFTGLWLVGCNSIEVNEITGIWADPSSGNFSNCYASFMVKDDSVFMTHFLEFKGQPFFEVGRGTIKNNIIEYKVKVKHPIEGWAVEGVHKLRLSKDGKTLEGTYHDGKGNKGPLIFKKLN